ncbi:ABC transporter permease [Metabacillus fastidiosus]|uniref:ABC transporter permease n=1 Tax=Metabacillus fastidiosus TaxID=1458 RepID=UPI002DBDF722|nr:ABC transporter permease [Metabacillus fastidiosus]MEC2075312.1 ABC transporter permease [Metabacillus fastidiosus]
MNFIKRAFLSITARKGKSLLLMGIFFIVISLVLAGFSIQNASDKATDNARKKLGASVTLGIDPQNSINALNKEVTEEAANKLKDSKYVKEYNYKSESSAIAEGFTPKGWSEDFKEGMPGMPLPAPGVEMPNLVIESTMVSGLSKSFETGESKIVEGKSITKDLLGENVTLIEKRLAEENNLKVGDKIKVRSKKDKEKTIELEIIGIYTTKEKANEFMNVPILDPVNKLYVPYKTIDKFEDVMFGTFEAVYYLDDPLHVNAFKEEAKQSATDFDGLLLDAKDSVYKQMIGPIKNIASTSQTIVYMVSIAGAVILGLIIMLSIKERRKEMGILLSIGERKWKLIGQLLVEVLFIAVLAFGLSLTTGSKVSQVIGDNLLSNEIATAAQSKDEIPGMMEGIPDPTQEKTIDQIDVSVTGGDIGKVGGIGLAIAILATILPALSVLRLNPKQILLKDE